MRIILDTNVLMSGIFFGGIPAKVLIACQEQRVRCVASSEVVREYQRVFHRLQARFDNPAAVSVFQMLLAHLELVQAPRLSRPLCTDPTDDMFFACAIAACVRIIVSGDRHLLQQHGNLGVHVLAPARFISQYI